MYTKNGGARPSWSALWRAPVRSLFLGVSGAVGAGLFAAAGGAILCLADGLPWAVAGAWGLRGAFGGLVAGVLIGALSALYHVEERRTEPKAKPAAPGKPPLAEDAPPVAALDRNGVHQNGSEDRGRGPVGKAVLF